MFIHFIFFFFLIEMQLIPECILYSGASIQQTDVSTDRLCDMPPSSKIKNKVTTHNTLITGLVEPRLHHSAVTNQKETISYSNRLVDLVFKTGLCLLFMMDYFPQSEFL